MGSFFNEEEGDLGLELQMKAAMCIRSAARVIILFFTTSHLTGQGSLLFAKLKSLVIYRTTFTARHLNNGTRLTSLFPKKSRSNFGRYLFSERNYFFSSFCAHFSFLEYAPVIFIRAVYMREGRSVIRCVVSAKEGKRQKRSEGAEPSLLT